MKFGETFRCARPYSAIPETVDGLRNLFHVTYSPDQKLVPIARGINPLRSVAAPEGLRCPAILITSSPHKVGSLTTPWQDLFDTDNGHIRYYGDNKSPGQDPAAAPGNKQLRDQYMIHNSPELDVRRAAVPIVFFKRVSRAGKVKGYLQFQGYGLVHRAELIVQSDRKSDCTFSNYVFDFVILNLAADAEIFDWDWIRARQSSVRTLEETLRYAPKAWKEWVAAGPKAVERCRRRISKLQISKSAEQRPQKNSREAGVLDEIYQFYKQREARFEGLAAEVLKHMISGSNDQFMVGWLTPPSGDGGADIVGRLDVGTGFSQVKLVVLGQAKCEKPSSTTSGRDIARTVARLKRGWIGAYITTSYFSEPVQREVIEDQYPLIMVHGLRLAEEVLIMMHEQGFAAVTDLLEDVDQRYQGMIQIRRPEEILSE